MNNKGFTLVEIICTLTIIALITMIIAGVSGNTLSLGNEEAYKITKNNIVKATSTYILECENQTLECNLNWNDNTTTVNAKELINAGYFKELKNPINNKDLSSCIEVEVIKNNNNYKYNINDNKCK